MFITIPNFLLPEFPAYLYSSFVSIMNKCECHGICKYNVDLCSLLSIQDVQGEIYLVTAAEFQVKVVGNVQSYQLDEDERVL